MRSLSQPDALDALFAHRPVADGLAAVDALAEECVADARRICETPAPPFQEAERGRLFAGMLAAARAGRPETDEAGNVFLRLPGDADRPPVVVAAHLDTVFAAGTDVTTRREAGRVFGPGIGDNALGCAAVIALARLFRRHPARGRAPLLLGADVGEEERGNLRGMRALLERLSHRVGELFAVEGVGLGRIVNEGVGSCRFEVEIALDADRHAEGSHSFGNFGAPSAIHLMAPLLARAAALRAPARPRTTFNVGAVSGGGGLTTIASRAAFAIDLRSVSGRSLARLERSFLRAVSLHGGRSGLRPHELIVREIGRRPAGRTPPSLAIVKRAGRIYDRLGRKWWLKVSSTDANLAMARGIPAICLGVTLGGNGHNPGEYIETAPVAEGLRALYLNVAGAALGLGGE
ncbi:MAG: M20/M25/M40 family metallo-hydrolase [Planctomycetes bacterium]|nr:M20/M25/M40 family metallo-hydrolase [Planctomycetota bacterium]